MTEICSEFHQLCSGLARYRFPFDANTIPNNGIYILFEQGELAHGTDRIVRVGTHTGNNQLPSRLEQHFVKSNKDRSIFRKNIGRALLNRDKDPFLELWEIDQTTDEAKRKYAGLISSQKLQETERRVTEYMQQNLCFAVFRVDEKAQRLAWESKIISTVSLCAECRPSPTWLGLNSPKTKIRESGLWLVNELYKEPLSESEFEAVKLVTSSSW